MIIVPDLHGRKKLFEKAKVEFEKSDSEKIIFLGDYLDPYPHENILPEEAVVLFKEVIKFKKENHGRVILLLGNHDLHYLLSRQYYGSSSRFDYSVYQDVHQIYDKERDLFSIGYYIPVVDQHYIFTHAGILDRWCIDYVNLLDEEKDRNFLEVIDAMNDFLWKKNDKELGHAMDCVSFLRGGYESAGSLVWADVQEQPERNFHPEYYQIFGHTQLRENPIIESHFADLDCRKLFRLVEDETKKIIEI